MIRRNLAFITLLVLIGLPGAMAQPHVLRGETVWTGTERGMLSNADIVIEDGRIVAITENGPAPVSSDAVVVESAWVTPGLISAFSQTGLVEVGAEDSTNDTSGAATPYSVALRAADGFNPNATPIDVTRIEGFTRIAVAPLTGANIFAGQGFVADTSGDPATQIRDKVFVYITLGEAGAATAGGSRPAAMTQLRAALEDARTFPARYIAHNEGSALNRTDAQAFGNAARGRQLILIEADRASDLNAIMDLVESDPALRIAILGADEGWMVAERLASLRIPVILDAFSNLPSRFENLASTAENAGRLVAAGVTISIVHMDDNSHQARLATQVAGNAVANGLDKDAALAALTYNPATLFGLQGYGRLEVGAPADVVAWDGDPLEVTSSPVAVYIDGKAQSLESRQTRLRDRYADLTEEDERPLAYKRP